MGKLLLIFCIFIFSTPAFSQDRPDAYLKYKNREYEEAVAICLNELESMPRNMDSYTVLGWSLLALGRNEEALEYGEKAYEILPTDPRIVEILGEAHFRLENNLESLVYFERYAVLYPTGQRIDVVYNLMGEILLRLKEYNHADIAFSTAVYHSSNISKWWARLGYAREMAENYRYALEAYEKALSLNPTLTDAIRGRDRATDNLR